jgi:hypothetical protein
VGVTGPSNLRLWWTASAFFVVFFGHRGCSAPWLGDELGFDALHGTLVETD